MIGFFEHQYLSYKKAHIKNLLSLAKVDGHVHAKEEKMLYKIGKRYGLKDRQVKELVDSKEKFKMNLLYDLLLMIYADDVVDKHEVEFFEDAVKKFGMKKEMVKWLFTVFEKGTPPPADDWEEIKKEAKNKYTIKA
jgi:uncharacterized membrane protein YebE (DUF533 family)